MATPAEKSKVLLFGLGAIGGFYAFIISRNPQVSLTVVARSNYEALKTDGLKIQSENHGEHVVHPANVVKTAADAGGYFDYVVFATKAIDQSQLTKELKPVVGDDTTIVIIQNGVGNEDPFREAFPHCTILTCVTWVGARQTTPGTIAHSKAENMEIGLFPNPSVENSLESSRLDIFTGYLRAGGTVFTVVSDMQLKRWEKVVWNAAWNSLTTLTMLDTQSWLDSSPGAMTMSRQLMREVIDVAKACDVGLEYGLIDTLVDKVVATGGIGSSMQTDAKAGRPLEVDVILGTPFRKAREFGLQTPVLDTIYVLTVAVDCRLRANT